MKDANAMEKKANELMKDVPDIELEEMEESPEPIKKPKKKKGKKQGNSNRESTSDLKESSGNVNKELGVSKSGVEESFSFVDLNGCLLKGTMDNFHIPDFSEIPAPPPQNPQNNSAESVEGKVGPIKLESDEADFEWDVQTRNFAQQTRLFRMANINNKLNQQKLEFGERDAFVRESLVMKQFSKFNQTQLSEQAAIDKKNTVCFTKPSLFFPAQSEDKETLPSIVPTHLPDIFPEFFFHSNSFPSRNFFGTISLKRKKEEPRSEKKRHKKGEDLSFFQNVEDAIKLNNIEKKIHCLRSSQEEPHLTSPEVSPISLNKLPLFAERQATLVLRKAVAMVLLHEGFDSATTEALNVLVDLASQHLLSLSSSLARFQESSEVDLVKAVQASLSNSSQELCEYVEHVTARSSSLKADIEATAKRYEELMELKEKDPELFKEQLYKEEEVKMEDESSEEEEEEDVTAKDAASSLPPPPQIQTSFPQQPPNSSLQGNPSPQNVQAPSMSQTLNQGHPMSFHGNTFNMIPNPALSASISNPQLGSNLLQHNLNKNLLTNLHSINPNLKPSALSFNKSAMGSNPALSVPPVSSPSLSNPNFAVKTEPVPPEPQKEKAKKRPASAKKLTNKRRGRPPGSGKKKEK